MGIFAASKRNRGRHWKRRKSPISSQGKRPGVMGVEKRHLKVSHSEKKGPDGGTRNQFVLFFFRGGELNLSHKEKGGDGNV